VKFLVDHQLPPSLAAWIQRQGHEAVHVREIGLASGTDELIWVEAEKLKAVILTKDEDSLHLWAHRRLGRPVVWIRVGNCTHRVLLEWLEPLWLEIIQRLEAGSSFIEVGR